MKKWMMMITWDERSPRDSLSPISIIQKKNFLFIRLDKNQIDWHFFCYCLHIWLYSGNMAMMNTYIRVVAAVLHIYIKYEIHDKRCRWVRCTLTVDINHINIFRIHIRINAAAHVKDVYVCDMKPRSQNALVNFEVTLINYDDINNKFIAYFTTISIYLLNPS